MTSIFKISIRTRASENPNSSQVELIPQDKHTKLLDSLRSLDKNATLKGSLNTKRSLDKSENTHGVLYLSQRKTNLLKTVLHRITNKRSQETTLAKMTVECALIGVFKNINEIEYKDIKEKLQGEKGAIYLLLNKEKIKAGTLYKAIEKFHYSYEESLRDLLRRDQQKQTDSLASVNPRSITNAMEGRKLPLRERQVKSVTPLPSEMKFENKIKAQPLYIQKSKTEKNRSSKNQREAFKNSEGSQKHLSTRKFMTSKQADDAIDGLMARLNAEPMTPKQAGDAIDRRMARLNAEPMTPKQASDAIDRRMARLKAEPTTAQDAGKINRSPGSDENS